MKKLRVCAMGLCVLFALTGCGAKTLSVGDVSTSTMYINKDSEVQSAIIEVFDKDYYSEEELKQYLDTEIQEYNSQTGTTAVELTSYEVKDGKAAAVMSYVTMNDYRELNQVEAYLYTGMEAEAEGVLPDGLTFTEEGSGLSKADIAASQDYKVIILNEEYDVEVEGDIIAYSGGSLVKDSMMHIPADAQTVIVYK